MSKNRWQSKDNLREVEQKVLKSLYNVKIHIKGLTATIMDSSTVGIKTYGKLDFLKNYCNYTIIDKRTGGNQCSYNGMYHAGLPTH